jgi:hypothetical protein
MESVRLRRLKADYDAVRRLVRLHPRIDIEGVLGNPPDTYRLVLHVRSLRERAGEIAPAHEHRLEIKMPAGYPRDAPLFRMLTPVFHPNIAPHAVCIGDHWTAGESLEALIQRVGEMLSYQSYNIKSPLNGRAAQWVEENAGQVPTDREEFFLDLSAEPVVDSGGACANCGAQPAPGEDAGLAAPCAAGHQLCGDCAARCERCGGALCLVCGISRCAACTAWATAPAPAAAAASTSGCANCGAAADAGPSCLAGHLACGDCSVFCTTCGARLCLVCGTYPCRSCTRGAEDMSPPPGSG